MYTARADYYITLTKTKLFTGGSSVDGSVHFARIYYASREYEGDISFGVVSLGDVNLFYSEGVLHVLPCLPDVYTSIYTGLVSKVGWSPR